MSTTQLPPYQRLAQSAPDNPPPKAMSGTFIRLKYDLAKCVQSLPELTHDEIIQANVAAGGFTWLDDPSEDIYS